MTRWFTMPVMAVLLVAGCTGSSSVSPPIIVGERTVTVSSEDPFIEIEEDGTRLAVDGVPLGESIGFKLTKTKDEQGRISVTVDTWPESAPRSEKP